MTGNADYSLHGPGGIEVTGPTPINHTVDERKNRGKTPKRRKRRPPPKAQRDQLPAQPPEEDIRQDLADDDETKPTVDFLA